MPREFLNEVAPRSSNLEKTCLTPARRLRTFCDPVLPHKKWVRLAAWDLAGNGALVQPVKLTPEREAR